MITKIAYIERLIQLLWNLHYLELCDFSFLVAFRRLLLNSNDDDKNRITYFSASFSFRWHTHFASK